MRSARKDVRSKTVVFAGSMVEEGRAYEDISSFAEKMILGMWAT
jgi:hypothetical protein